MRIGILTLHCAHNYGAVLQAYGLQEYMKSHGHEVYIIDYRPDYVVKNTQKDNPRMWLSRNPKMCIQRLANYIRYRKIRHARWAGFHKFIENRFNLYRYEDRENFHEFDAILIGSDQVWSPYHTGGWYKEIMFGVGFKCKSIAYAASCSMDFLTNEQSEYLKHHLDNMTAISVREQKFKELIQPLTQREIAIAVDPTILAGKIVFNNIAELTNTKQPYVLIYEIKQHGEVYRIATELAQQLGADIVELTNGMLNYHRKTMDEGATPEKFLGYLKNAECVITTSFHGTIFSILFNKPFYTVKQNSPADIRMTSLLEQLHLENRLVKMNDHPVFSVPNYSQTDKYLDEIRKISEQFIQFSLES